LPLPFVCHPWGSAVAVVAVVLAVVVAVVLAVVLVVALLFVIPQRS
jgi:hypothetical protein